MALIDTFRKFLTRISLPLNLSLTDEKAWNPKLWSLNGAITGSGEQVDEESALTYSAVWNAVWLISSTIGTLPLHLMEKKDKKKQYSESENLYRVMHDKANPFMTAANFRMTQKAHVLTWGNGYAEIVRNKLGDIVELWPIAPNRIIDIKMIENNLWYFIKVDSETIALPRERILHLHGLGFDGFVGYSPIAMARKSIGLSMAMETFGENYFGQGTHPGVIVSHPGQLSEKAHKNLKNSLTDTYSGLGQSHRLMLLEDSMKIEKIGIPPEDSQFLQSRQHQVTDVARWFNLPPHKLKDLTRSSFNNIESEQISFVVESILPWLVLDEQEYNMQLLNLSQQRRKLYFKHSVEGLLRGSSKDRAEFYKNMFQVGMSINQILEKEDMNPVDHDFADVPWVPLNYVPITEYEQHMAKNNQGIGGKNNDSQTPNSENDVE